MDDDAGAHVNGGGISCLTLTLTLEETPLVRGCSSPFYDHSFKYLKLIKIGMLITSTKNSDSKRNNYFCGRSFSRCSSEQKGS